MKLFNRNKKEEEELEFNYDEMMAAAKLEYSYLKTNSNNPNYSYYEDLISLVESNEFSYVYRTHIISNDITKQYERAAEETNCIGVYDKNDKLLLTFEIDLDKLILFRYLIKYFNRPIEFSVLYKKIDMQPIKNLYITKDLITKYSVIDILCAILNCNHNIFSNDENGSMTSDYIETAIKMYIGNKNKNYYIWI